METILAFVYLILILGLTVAGHNTNLTTEEYKERKAIFFLEKPPRVHVNDVGGNATFNCLPDPTNETTDIQMYWVFPSRVQNFLLTDAAGSFIKVNNSELIFVDMKKEFAGYYKCVLSDGDRSSFALMRLHVLLIHKVQLEHRLIIGSIACACAVVIFGAIILFNKFYLKKTSRLKKQVELRHYESTPLKQ